MPAYTEALERALGGIVARAHGELALVRERADAIVAQAEARAAAADARFAALEKQVADKLAAVTDGKDGRDGVDGKDGNDGKDGRDGADGAPGKDGLDGRDGTDGKDGVGIVDIAPWEDGLMIDLSDDRTLLIGPFKGADGKDGRNGKDADPITDEQIAASVQQYLEANPPAAGRDGKDGFDGAPGKDGLDGRDGKDGERGAEGPAGKLPLAKAWTDEVHYEGDVVSHDGSTWQALRDTGRQPAPGDWIMLAGKGEAGAPGADGRSFEVRGTYAAGADYCARDVVALNGSSFVAKVDNPGPCPGEGWQLVASRGARGQEGGRGERGAPGPSVMALHVDDDGRQTLVNADGSEVSCDLYPLLSRIG